jgi:hypothetical protein
MPALQLSCVPEAIPNAGGGTSEFSVPGGGMVFLLSTIQGQAAHVGPDTMGNSHWQCVNIRYTIPYFCPFDEIACLQPLTLNPLPFTIRLQGGFYLFPLGCAGFPGSITLVPA